MDRAMVDNRRQTSADFPAAGDMADSGFDQAVSALKSGRAAVFPTDTVYGLGVAVGYAESAREVSDIKHRDPAKPIAWLVGDIHDLDRYGSNVSEQARELAQARWPGALTLIVSASDAVPAAYRTASGTIGLRVPADETALALIREVGPLAASSANRAGQEPPRSFGEIDEGVLNEVAACVLVDGCCAGKASMVVDASGDEMIVLRD